MIKECPYCGPVEVVSSVLFSGYGLVDPVTKKVIEYPAESGLVYSDEELLNCLMCPKCGCENL